MEVSHYGAGCIYITTKQINVLIDPPAADTGIKLPKLKADVVLHTTRQDDLPNKDGDSLVIACPGEYEVQGVTIQGVAVQLHVDDPKNPHEGVMYSVGANGVRVLVTGNVAPELKDSQVDQVGEVNVLVVPVGGHGLTLDAQGAAGLVSRFEPQYVVPVHYSDGIAKYSLPQDDLKPFLNETGSEGTLPVPKLKVVAKDLGENTDIVVLEVSK